MRNGIEIWVDQEVARDIQNWLRTPGNTQFFEVNGRTLNKVDLIGVFEAIDLEELKRRKNGEWKCKHNNWHRKDEICECRQEMIWQKKQSEVFEMSKPLTDQQVKSNKKTLKAMREDLINKKIIRK